MAQQASVDALVSRGWALVDIKRDPLGNLQGRALGDYRLVVLLGGKSFLLGPVIGALVYLFLPDYLGLSPIRSQIAFGVILIVMIF